MVVIMYALDFRYDGQSLSDYGFIICNFKSSSGANVATAGSKITFKTVSHNKGKRYGLTDIQYNECFQTTFDICKNPDLFDDLSISSDEFRDLMRWLNRNEYLRFQVIHDEYVSNDAYLFDGSFNVKKITIGDILYGLELTLETNRPFAYGLEKKYSIIVDDPSISHKIRDLSDDIGLTYPKVVITCHANGNLTLHNKMTNCKTTILNCSEGEEITIDGENYIIYSSNKDHDICNDFNYSYFTIGNKLNDRDNYISANLPCHIQISYFPIIKDCP